MNNDVSDYTSDKINLKDYAGYAISVIVFLLLIWVVPQDKLSYYFNVDMTVSLVIKILISLVLSVAIYFGLQYLFYPKSQFEVDTDLANMSYAQSLQRILDIANLAKSASKLSTRKLVADKLDSESKMLRSLHKRFVENHKPVELNRLVLILQQFAEGLVKYCKLKDPETIINSVDRKKEIDDTELDLVPKAEVVIFNIGQQFDSGLLSSKNVADGSFEELAKSFVYLSELNKE